MSDADMTIDPSDIDDSLISLNARKVIRRLNEAGYQAYLVGGGVRDLLLGLTPKDFDVATDALPDEVLELFRNSRAIGKRFKIVHVRFGREIIEVATFRAAAEPEQADSGLILSDNEYGTLKEDVERRDFTVNALYYDPEANVLHDEVGGLADLKARRLRLLGDPEARYREDPVRMLRAIRFAAKLDFDFDPETEQPIRRLAHLIQEIPPARLFEETLKLFMNGSGVECFERFREYELFDWMFPAARQCAEDPESLRIMELALASTDRRINAEKSVTPAFVFAAFLWPPFVDEKATLVANGMPSSDASHEAANSVVADQQSVISIPKRFTGMMRDIWQLQFRLPNRAGKRAAALAAHRRFRAAYDFLIIREDAGEDLDGLGQWWTDYQDASGEKQKDMANSLQTGGRGGGAGRRGGRGRGRGGGRGGGNKADGNRADGNRADGNSLGLNIDGNSADGNTLGGNSAGGNGGGQNRRRRKRGKRKPKEKPAGPPISGNV
ncbi:MAG: poly(A) polymerase [Gammaproteobacteria bacterium]|nr:poly(A) polymerase [Gammaproteobacteria bacterium]